MAPLASDRERIIEKMGEVIWVESLEQTLLALPDVARGEAVRLLNDGDIDAVVEIFEENNLDIDAIIAESSKSVLGEVLDSPTN